MGFGDKSANYARAVEVAEEDSQFVDRILEVSNSVDEAIRRTKLTDVKMLNDITKLRDWLVAANKTGKLNSALQTLKFFLDGQLSIGGYNFALAIQGHAKIPVPSAMGVHLSKEDSRNIKEIAMAREKRQVHQNEEEVE